MHHALFVSLDDDEVDDEADEADDEHEVLDTDCMSMSIQVAVTVDVVPNMLKPLSSLPLGS